MIYHTQGSGATHAGGVATGTGPTAGLGHLGPGGLAKRFGRSRRSPASTSTSSAGRPSASSARTAPARPRRSRSCARSSSRPPARPASRATTSCAERDDVRRSIGLVFQDTTLDDYLTAEQNLRFHAVLYGVPARRGRRAAARGARDGRAHRPHGQRVRTYSGGMKRRLEIARGLLHSPRVLFLDEPTIGLDPQTRAHIWDYVDELKQREDITIFLTTHYMDEAERCDRIAIIDQRRDRRARHAGGAEGERRARTASRSRTPDDEAAIAALRERFGLEAARPRGRGDVRGASRASSSCPGCSPSSACRSRRSGCRGRRSTTCSCRTPGRTIRDAEAVNPLKAMARLWRGRR